MNDAADDEVVSLHNKGDLVLAIRDASGFNYRRFLVSSTILSHASRVFAAMFGPHFKEGHQLRESIEPPVINLRMKTLMLWILSSATRISKPTGFLKTSTSKRSHILRSSKINTTAAPCWHPGSGRGTTPSSSPSTPTTGCATWATACF
jgi:hypothetical protein